MLIAVRSCIQAFLAAAVAFLVMAPQGVAGPARSEAADESACAALTALHVSGTAISQASVVAAGAAVDSGDPRVMVSPQPEHCLVRGEVGHHVGADGHRYGNRFELRLPKSWSGRLLFQGGGGLDGIVRPAIGLVAAGSQTTIPSALSRGYAVVSTDAGHDQSTLAAPGDFGADPQALADYAYNSTRAVTQTALSIAQRYYRRRPKHTYFMGCSTGGREGLIAAQRYPQMFDGVIAGTPAFRVTRAMVAEAWTSGILAAIAPRDPSGRPSLAQALSERDLHLLADAVLAKCDALDGLKDGLIGDPQACRFDPQVLACKESEDGSCLSAAKVGAVRKIFSGPEDSAGHALYSDWPYDTGIGEPGWRLWILGSERLPALNVLIAPAAINGLALANQPPPIDILHFDFDTDPKRIDRIAEDVNAVSTNYSRASRGAEESCCCTSGSATRCFPRTTWCAISARSRPRAAAPKRPASSRACSSSPA